MQAYHIYTDPPGAHVYGEDGSYWGKTSDNSPVKRRFTNHSEPKIKHTITVKKRGYRTTKHRLNRSISEECLE